jgi:hypothetical protein
VPHVSSQAEAEKQSEMPNTAGWGSGAAPTIRGAHYGQIPGLTTWPAPERTMVVLQN